MEIITKKFQEIEIDFSTNVDKTIFINATKVAFQFQKKPVDWLKTKETQNYIKAVSKAHNLSYDNLVKIVKGGNDPKLMGTWIHKKLIIFFARWLSVEFAVWCDNEIEKILQQKQPTLSEFQETLQFAEIFEKFSEISKNKTNLELLQLDNFLKKLNKKSILEILNLDFSNSYFSVTELGKLLGKSGAEINQLLEKIGFQKRVFEKWELLENGKKFAFETQNQFSQIKWKFGVLKNMV
jgi:hypothetical protein